VYGCERYPWEVPPNVVVISIDTLRADHCSVNGYERDTTPNLRKLAEHGTRFETAYSPTSTTAPSHATMFTGLSPVTHGVVKNGIELGSDFTTLAELLREDGYQTAAVAGSFAMAGKFGFEQGFDSYDDDFPKEGSTYDLEQWQGHAVRRGFDRRATETTEIAVDWLRDNREENRPFLLFVHYFDPHDPYDPPAEYEERLAVQVPEFLPTEWRERKLFETVAKYDAEILYTDSEIGNLLAVLNELDLEEDTVVIVTSDHGEGLMDHGWFLHGAYIYEEQVRVPMLVRWPERVAAGRTISEPVEMIDLLPTILGFIGRSRSAENLPGRDLGLAMLREEPKSLKAEHPIHLFRQHFREGMHPALPLKGVQHGLRDGRWKVILAPEEGTRELYDLEEDPGESVDLAEENPFVLEILAGRIDDRIEGFDDGGDIGHRAEEDVERLKALGYVD
jgi:arylsulfatase A-like enzyme